MKIRISQKGKERAKRAAEVALDGILDATQDDSPGGRRLTIGEIVQLAVAVALALAGKKV